MKIFKYSYFVMIFAALFTSCMEDDLKLNNPNNAVVDYYFNNQDEFEKAIRGAYNGLKGIGLYSGSGSAGDIIIVPDLLADNLILSPEGRGSNRDGHNWTINASNAPTYLYNGAYTMIARTNLILANIDNLDDNLFPKKELIRAEALALRGMAHFEVARLYVKIPTQSSDANSFVGIPYIDYFDPYGEPSRLATVQETYARIMEDLEVALPELPTTVQADRLSQPALRVLIGRVALYMGDYDKVISMLTPVVSSIQPVAANKIVDLWRNNNSDGVLFEVPMLTANGDPDYRSNYSQGTNNIDFVPEYSVDKAFRDLYNDATEPDRIKAYFKVLKNQYNVWKYVQTKGGTSAYIRYLRVEEAILSLAEAQYMKHQEGAALTTLNKLRDARYSSYSGGESGDALFDAIQLERRKELAFEGDRFFTIKRLLGVPGIPAKYHQGVVRSGNGHLQDGTGQPSDAQFLDPSSHKWQMPIDYSSLLFDPNVTQTPGY
ncbi:MAG: RagB/SusD family nutrient uptake outer membrane protein [Flavobacteriia bacterium]|nr:RagB/SusD family nutrient uptake outer membrane protein [Flavobacteriia bacterium]